MGPIVAEFKPRDFSEFIDFAAQEIVEPGDQSRGGSMGASWYGTSSFEEALSLVRGGWPIGLAKVEEIYSRLYRAVGEKIKKTDFEYNVSGSVVDVGRFCSGEPECFMEFTEKTVEGPGRIVTITVNMFVSAGIDERTVFLRGAGVLTLVDALEEAGYSVAINGRYYMKGKGHDRHEDFLFPVKRPGEAVESDRLAFVFCHRSMTRRLMFATGEHLKGFRENAGHNPRGYYGSPVSPMDDKMPEGTTIYLKSLDYERESFSSEANVTAWVLKQLVAQGIEVEGV